MSIVPYCFYTIFWMTLSLVFLVPVLFRHLIQKRRGTVTAQRFLFVLVISSASLSMGLWGYQLARHDAELRNEWVETTTRFDKVILNDNSSKLARYKYTSPHDQETYFLTVVHRKGEHHDPTKTIWVSSISGRYYQTDPGEWWFNSNPSTPLSMMMIGVFLGSILAGIADWAGRQVDWNMIQHNKMVEAKAAAQT
jgi:uncharacterized protein (DUF58 family)